MFGMVSCSLSPEPTHFSNTIKKTCKRDNFLLLCALICSLIHACSLFCSGVVIPAAEFRKAQPGLADAVQSQAVIQTPKQEAQHQLTHPGLRVQSQATQQPEPQAFPLCFTVLKCCFSLPVLLALNWRAAIKMENELEDAERMLTFYLCHFYLYHGDPK